MEGSSGFDQRLGGYSAFYQMLIFEGGNDMRRTSEGVNGGGATVREVRRAAWSPAQVTPANDGASPQRRCHRGIFLVLYREGI
jgi:hypothetical protein